MVKSSGKSKGRGPSSHPCPGGIRPSIKRGVISRKNRGNAKGKENR